MGLRPHVLGSNTARKNFCAPKVERAQSQQQTHPEMSARHGMTRQVVIGLELKRVRQSGNERVGSLLERLSCKTEFDSDEIY